MKDLVLDARSERMLELLAQGAGSKDIAKDLGYQDGTMRVYLHNLYRKLGVANKTAAVIWYMKRQNGGDSDASTPAPVKDPLPRSADIVGDMALAEGLYATLGVMTSYVGPWSRVWEAGAKAAGDDSTAESDNLRARSRALWNALLRGDFSHGKALYDTDDGYGMLSAPASDGVMLACLLVAGGFSHAASQFFSRLVDRRRSRPTVHAREVTLLEATFEAFEGKDPGGGFVRLQRAIDGNSPPAIRHLAMALLFYSARARRDSERARYAANALWLEAEAAARELRAAGGEGATAGPKRASAKAQAREKAAAT